MVNYDIRTCGHRRRPIAMGRRCVREKVYLSPRSNQVPAYRHFHAEPFGERNLSCWGKTGWTENSLKWQFLSRTQARRKGRRRLADCMPQRFQSPHRNPVPTSASPEK